MDRERVLFIGAHPDDIDLGCAISLHDHYLKNNEIITIVLTKGEKGGDSSERTIEQENSFKILCPNSKNHFLNFPDTKLFFYTNKIIDIITSLIFDKLPSIVYIPSNNDFHQDHVTTHDCALSVFNNHKVKRILCYETPSTMPSFTPNYFKFCDLNHFSVKLKALNCHKSQINKAYFLEETIYSTAKMRAAQGRYYESLAEAYEIKRLADFSS
jgi:LmbE family N-acetylglucosaminyl deacetylase